MRRNEKFMWKFKADVAFPFFFFIIIITFNWNEKNVN